MQNHDANQTAGELGRIWNASLEQAFSAPPTQPEQYQRVLRLVGAIANALRTRAQGQAELVEWWPRRTDLLAELVAADGRLATTGLDVEPLLGAGFAMRLRELNNAAQAAGRLAAIAGRQGWVVLAEDGYAPGDPFVPYHRIEVDATTGAGVHAATEPDEVFAGVVHSVTPVRLDLASGELEFDLTASRTFADADAREAHAASLKAGLDAASEPDEGDR